MEQNRWNYTDKLRTMRSKLKAGVNSTNLNSEGMVA